jgi:heat shock protein HslJ/membrane-bound inhibitor of C-type lysozyme
MTKNAKIIVLILLVIIAGVLVYAFRMTPQFQLEQNNVDIENVSITTGDKITSVQASYISAKDEEATVTYFGRNASLDRLGTSTERIMFELAISASGARYENKELGMVLWEKAPDLNIYKNDKVIFSGRKTDVVIEEKQRKLLTSGVWVWDQTFNGTGPEANKGGIIKPKKYGDFTLTFTVDGKVNGKTDCNGLGGTYEFGEGKITFGPLASNLMYCEGSQEADFIKMLTNSTSSIIYAYNSTDQLTLENTVTVNFFRKK